MALTQVQSGMMDSVAQYYSFKNKIINGGMVIDQRNSGAAISAATLANFGFIADRFLFYSSQSAKFSAQQNQGSVTPPVGFTNYIGLTSASAYSVLTSDYFILTQRIEGYNVADLNWGSANAATVTLSFKVYTSLTGTHSGCIVNAAGTRSYPFTFTVSSANTWATINITIAGDTTGTWLTTNGTGIEVRFNLGSGATFSGTAGAWAAGNFVGVTGAVSVVGTSGATFYITGVQLEKGSTATAFDYRPYGTELSLCQRYYVQYTAAASNWFNFNGFAYSGSSAVTTISVVPLRTAPTLALSGSGTFAFNDGAANYTVTSPVLRVATYNYDNSISVAFTATSLVAYRPGGFFNTNATNPISLTISAEL
jgi:hypothetical protein